MVCSKKEKLILILREAVIIPGAIMPLFIGRHISIKTIEQAMDDGGIGIFLQKNKDQIVKNIDDIYEIGVYGKIIDFIRDAKKNIKIIIEGQQSIKLNNIKQNDLWYGSYDNFFLQSKYSNSFELEILWNKFCEYYDKYKKYNTKVQDYSIPENYTIEEIDKSLYVCVSALLIHYIDRQKYIMKNFLEDRIYFLINYMIKEMAIYNIETDLKSNIQEQLEDSQKEYYLKEQLKAIQKELSGNDSLDDVYSIKVIEEKCLEKNIPNVIIQKLTQEAKKLEHMQEISAEASVVKNYIDCLFSLPWNKYSDDNVSINEAEDILNRSHFGLIKVKERILEFIGALKYAGNKIKKPIICLVGPPGVGKTSFAKSIADALNREFVMISLGGCRDEADIKGHRKTYVAAMPGKIIQAFRKISTLNPIILLDEIDKMTHDSHGDPSASLLEVLDSEQNKNFVDSYLDVSFDLSNAIFITTANSVDNIPFPLLDRLDLIYLSGYTFLEKSIIVKNFIFSKILSEHNIKESDLILTDNALKKLILEYTKESGVRGLSRLLVRIVRKIINKFFFSLNPKNPIIIDESMLIDFFKCPQYKNMYNPNPYNKVGIMSGLAWTEVGGDILEIETALVPGKGNIQLTGQLGEVMQESAQTAFTYVKSVYKRLKINRKKFFDYDVHIHIPEGAIPKDGPSAGIAMTIALISLFTNRPINQKIAMTGEVTLQGRVSMIGGIKEKLLAADMYEYDTVIFPLQNKLQVEELISELQELKVQILYCGHIDEILKIVFGD